MVIAVANTGSFEFVALGEDREQARRALVAAWRVHVRQYDPADRRLMQRLIADGDVNYIEGIEPGACARDWTVIA